MFDVMIIDDEADARERLINRINWEELSLRLVAQAADGDTARELFLLHQPKIVITDINLPETTGLLLVEEFLKMDPLMQCIVVTGYNDFSYAQQALRIGAIELLLKPASPEGINRSLRKATEKLQSLRQQTASMKNMQRLLDENIPVIRNSYLGRLLRVGQESAEAIRTKFRDLHIDCTGPYYAIALLSLSRNGCIDQYESACLLMEEQLRQLLCATNFQYHLFFDSHFRLTCLFSSEKDGIDEELESILLILKKQLLFLDDFQLFAGISKTINTPELLSDAFTQAKTALNFQNVLSQDSVVHYKNVNAYEANQSSHYWTIHELRQLFLQKDYALLSNRLKECIHNLETKENSLSQIRSFLLDLLAQFYGECSRQSIPVESIMSSSDLLQVFTSQNTEDVLACILTVIENMMALQSAQHSNNNHHLINLAKTYMAENLHDQTLCLDTVSEAIGLSRSYFCDLFHKTESISFSNYLKNLRISYAKDLLRTKNLKVYEVADASGFSNVKYFCYIFKRTVGMTPIEYQVHCASTPSN